MGNKAAQKYLIQFRRALVCPREARLHALAREEALLANYLEEVPDALYDDLICAFGRPEDLAADTLLQMEPEEVERVRKQRKYIRWGIIALTAAILVAISVFWYCKFRSSENLNENAIIVIEPAQKMTEEETREMINEILKNK